MDERRNVVLLPVLPDHLPIDPEVERVGAVVSQKHVIVVEEGLAGAFEGGRFEERALVAKFKG